MVTAVQLQVKPPPTTTRWLAALASMAAFLLPVWLLSCSGDAGFGPVRFLFSGAAFAQRPLMIGGALDQPSLQKEIFVLCYSLVVIGPSLVFVRWINRQAGRGVRRLFAACSLVLLVHPLSILTIFSYDVFRYLLHMGLTPMRLAGLVIGLLTYPALAWLAVWLCGDSPKKMLNDLAQTIRTGSR